MVGFTNNYVKVERPFDKNLVNTIQTVTLGEWNEERSALKMN
jgi:threonylcarbamoyladenosine tRNA methylthiotransferase MtaB